MVRIFPLLSPTVPLDGYYKASQKLIKYVETKNERGKKRIFQYIKNIKRSSTKRSKQDRNKVKMNSESKL